MTSVEKQCVFNFYSKQDCVCNQSIQNVLKVLMYLMSLVVQSI